jgi:hypothetical protein
LNLHASKRMIIPSAFIILSATSTVFLVVSTVNYLGFFPALSQITAKITSLVLVNASTGGHILTSVYIDNPSDYSGFKVATIYLTTNFSNSSTETLFQNSLASFQSYFTPLPARTHISLNASLPLDPEQTAQLSSFYTSSRGMIVGSCTLDVKISTFLDNAVGYIDTQQSGPSVQNLQLVVVDPVRV